MISRRKFLAGAIAAAAAPMVAPELTAQSSGMAILMQNGPTIRDAMQHNEARIKNAIYRMMLDNAHIAANPIRIPPDDDGPTIKYIPPSFDYRALYHFDQPNGRCPDELNCHFCKFTHKTYGTTIEADSEDELLKRIGAR